MSEIKGGSNKYKPVDEAIATLPPLGSTEFWEQLYKLDREIKLSVYVALMREFYGRGQPAEAAHVMGILVELINPLALKMVRGWGIVREHPELAEDLVQSVWIGLVKKVQNGERTHFEVNFISTLRRRLIDALRAELPHYVDRISLDKNNSNEEDEGNSLAQRLFDPKNQAEFDLMELVQLLKEWLEPNELRIIELLTMSYNNSQIAQTLGIDRQTVTRRLDKVRDKIEKEFGYKLTHSPRNKHQ